ncbi:MAG TPA: hypothetical protein VI299_24775, partial [Polyangiales bacterium]
MMRRTLLAVTFLLSGCELRKVAPVPNPVDSAAPLTIAQVVVSKNAGCSSDRECARMPSPAGQTLLCEQGQCQPFDSRLALRWASSLIPELQGLQSDVNVKLSEAPWYREGGQLTLYALSNRDWFPGGTACEGISFSAQEGRLFADLDAQGRSTKQGPCSLRLSLSTGVRVWDTRCKDGVPSEHGGEERTPVDRLLSRADAKGLSYGALPIQVEPACQWVSLDREGCQPVRCESCSGFYLQTTINFGNTRSGSAPKNVQHEALPGACGPSHPHP